MADPNRAPITLPSCQMPNGVDLIRDVGVEWLGRLLTSAVIPICPPAHPSLVRPESPDPPILYSEERGFYLHDPTGRLSCRMQPGPSNDKKRKGRDNDDNDDN